MMNAQMSGFISYFGAPMKPNDAISIKTDIMNAFRKPYFKNDMTTHGPLWNQYSFPQGTITVGDIELDNDISGYMYVEGKGKDGVIFLTTWSQFVNYLDGRDDGLFPAIYFVNSEWTVCLCENGERGSMKPIYLYKGEAR